MFAECLVDCQQFIESRALALTLAGLSSYDSDMRQAAYHIMTFYLGHLEGARFRGRREVSNQMSSEQTDNLKSLIMLNALGSVCWRKQTAEVV